MTLQIQLLSAVKLKETGNERLETTLSWHVLEDDRL